MKINDTVRKAFSIFERGNGISRILQTNIPQGYKNHLPFYSGVHTITFSDSNAGTHRHMAKGLDFIVSPGFHDVGSEESRIHFLGGTKKKIFKTLVRSYYHVVADDLAEIVYALSISGKDTELILDITDIRELLDKPEWDLLKFFLHCLDKEKVKYTLVDLSIVDAVYIDNFSVLLFPYHSGARLNLLSDFLKKHTRFKFPENPNRKIFVSRARTNHTDLGEMSKNFSYPNDSRIDDHYLLEEVFVGLGFEVIYAESIPSFEEQISIFGSAKVVAGLTGSGLTNALFMNPGGILLEIATPLITHSPLLSGPYFEENGINPKDIALDPHLVQEIHLFYHNLAFFQELFYISIPNMERSHDLIRQRIESYPGLKDLLVNV